jgi:glyoxylase-like metal-dependent hydrolase (beta-lactamase superfamily II)
MHRLLHPGYIRDEGVTVGSSVSLVTDGEAVIVVDPGMVATRSAILDPLAEHGFAPGDVTHVVLTHHHPDHAMNAALFPKAELIDA